MFLVWRGRCLLGLYDHRADADERAKMYADARTVRIRPNADAEIWLRVADAASVPARALMDFIAAAQNGGSHAAGY